MKNSSPAALIIIDEQTFEDILHWNISPCGTLHITDKYHTLHFFTGQHHIKVFDKLPSDET